MFAIDHCIAAGDTAPVTPELATMMTQNDEKKIVHVAFAQSVFGFVSTDSPIVAWFSHYVYVFLAFSCVVHVLSDP